MNFYFSILLSASLLLSPLSFGTEAVDAYISSDGHKSGSGSEKGRTFYFLQAGMLGTAIAGANIITCVPSSYHFSHYAFIGGAGAIIAGEIVNAQNATDYHKSKKDSLKIDETKLNRPHGIVAQVEADLQTVGLKALKAEEEKNKGFMQERRKWVNFGFRLYDLATFLAGIEGILSIWSEFTGFVPDVLSCGALLGGPLMTAFTSAYAIERGLDHSNGKLGISTVAFMALLQADIAIASGVAIPLVRTAWGRIAYFGGSALILKEVRDGLDDRIGIATENIAKLDAVIKAWEINSKPTGGVAQGASVNPLPQTNYTSSHTGSSSYLHSTTSGATKSDPKCLGTSAQGVEHSSGACLHSIKFNRKLPNFKFAGLNNITKQAFDFSDAVAQGDMQGAAILGDAMAGNAARMTEIREEVFSELNKKLKEKGLSSIDFEAGIQAKYQEMKNDFKNEADKMAGATASVASLPSTENVSKDNSSLIKPAATVKSVPVPKTSLPLGNFSSIGPTQSPMSDEERDRMSANYDRTKTDYKTKDDDSLFQVVSKTYIRNLDKILVRKKRLDEESSSSEIDPSRP